MRLLFKLGLLLLLLSYVLPMPPDGTRTDDAALSPLVLLYGAQQAIADVGGFCTRAPAACASARDALGFAVDRIGDGAAFLAGHAAGTVPVPASGLPDDTEPAPPRAYTPPTAGHQAHPAAQPVAGHGEPRPREPAPAPTGGPLPYVAPAARTAGALPAQDEPQRPPLPRAAPPRA